MDFTSPVLTRVDPTVNFNWGTGSPAPGIDADTFSVRWTGAIISRDAGRYTFYTTTDDGVRLTINGQRIIDKMVPQSATEHSGSIDLVAGQKYDIVMEYFERAGGARAELRWSGPGISKQVVPQANLFS
jgi:PA14 domain